MFRETVRIFNMAAATGISDAMDDGTEEPDDAFLQAIKTNNEVFAAFRTHRMQNDIAKRMVDDKGELKSFSQFARDVRPYTDHQNRQWLRTEYNTAVIRAHQAADWRQFEAEKDVLPNLEWMPSTSPNPGKDHQTYWGTILPIDHPFWDQHRPGDRWNCKCSLRNTDVEPTPVPESGTGNDEPNRGLENNPGKDGKLFSDKHPYMPENCSSCPFGNGRLWALAAGRKKNCNSCRKMEKAIANTERKREAFRKSSRQAKKSAQDKAFTLLKNFQPKDIHTKVLQTGEFRDSNKGFRALLSHCYNEDSVRAAMSIRKKIGKLKFIRVSPFGEGKDLTDPHVQKNLKRKRRRGVTHYNLYEWKHNGHVYEVKMEVNKRGYESLYWLKKKKE